MRYSCLVAIALLAPGLARADELDTQRKALQLIREMAAATCDQVSQSGSETKEQISGKVGAQLPSLTKKLLELGISGAGKLQAEQYQGVVRAQLAEAVAHSSDCRLEVLKTLVKIVAPPPASVEQTSIRGPLKVQLVHCETALSGLQCILVVTTARAGTLEVVGPDAEQGLQSDFVASDSPLPYPAKATIDYPLGSPSHIFVRREDYIQPNFARRVYLLFEGLPADASSGDLTVAFFFDREPGKATFHIDLGRQ